MGVNAGRYRADPRTLDGGFAMSNASAASSPRPLSLHEFRKQRKPHRNIYRETIDKLSPMDKAACWITEHVGSMGFFLVILVWTVLWLLWNLLAPENLQFDPPTGFVFWLFISNLIQLLLMPLIMVGQNVQGRHSEMRAEHDLAVNVKAEEEIEVILQHLEYQNAILIAMVEKLGVSLDQNLRERALHPKDLQQLGQPRPRSAGLRRQRAASNPARRSIG
jgi:uncharacterized membrane protein